MKKQSEFKTQKEFFKYLVANKKELISFKKATIKFTDSFGISEDLATKALSTDYKDDLTTGIIKRTLVLNTYNWLDSHDDVHLDGTFTRSLNNNQDSIKHLHDHVQMITAKVGTPINVYEKSVKWRDLGIDKNGRTISVMMDSNIKKSYNEQVFYMYLNKEIDQHSVGMQYVDLSLAVNDPEYKEEFSMWNKHIDQLGNKEKALEQGYFWGVKEAKLGEGSAVIAGSNILTPTLNNEAKDDEENTEICDDLTEQKSVSDIWINLAAAK